MKSIVVLKLADLSDADVVARSAAGDRDAFGEIVARYQSLICAIAYSATGDVARSEDIAQETFFAAWRHLPELREPAKLRSWLSGIARNTINSAARRGGREPSHAAESLEALGGSVAIEDSPSVHAVKSEEAALVWRALEQLPETYREPLVLFYREQQSTTAVAAALDLTDEVVRQRLSRGRKLLHDEVIALVEGTLAATKPDRAFTHAVLSALPGATGAGMVVGAKAAGWASVKSAFATGGAGAVGGTLGSLIGWWVPSQFQVALARSPRERQLMVKMKWVLFALTIAYTGGIFGWVLLLPSWRTDHPIRLIVAFATLVVVFVAAVLVISLAWIEPARRRIRAEENAPPSPLEAELRKHWFFRPRNYRSQLEFLGLPLVDIRINRHTGEKFRLACGWIAIGDVAIGGLFALGGVALAPIGVAGFAIGGLAIGGFALGGGALGGGAAGYLAVGGAVAGWHAAAGGLAFARDFAVGGVAHALDANDDLARAALHLDLFEPHLTALISTLTLLSLAVAGGQIWLLLRMKTRWLRQ